MPDPLKENYRITKIEETNIAGPNPGAPTLGVLVTGVPTIESDPNNPTPASPTPTTWRFVENATEAANFFNVGATYELSFELVEEAQPPE